VNCLTALSEAVVKEPSDKEYLLKSNLEMINANLPSIVYVPFVHNSYRNYTVLNIAVEESRLFLTKQRAPYLVCVEVFRPEELKIWAKENSTGISTKKEGGMWANLKERAKKSKKTKA